MWAWCDRGLCVDRVESCLGGVEAVELWEGRSERTGKCNRLEGTGEGGTNAQLELCLCSTEESLVCVSVRRVEGLVGAGGVGKAFEDDFLAFRNVEQGTELGFMLDEKLQKWVVGRSAGCDREVFRAAVR